MKKVLLLFFLTLFASCCISYAMDNDKSKGDNTTVEQTQGVDAVVCDVLSVNPDHDVGVCSHAAYNIKKQFEELPGAAIPTTNLHVSNALHVAKRTRKGAVYWCGQS